MLKLEYDTTLFTKEKHLSMFFGLIKDQLVYGAKKYANSHVRESTDILCEVYGGEWLLGTMNKYLFRFKNTQREKDILKIAAYAYILWLKSGFHLRETHDADTNK